MAPKRRTTRLNPGATPTPVTDTHTTTSVTNAQLQAMIDEGVTAALAARDATRNGDDSHTSGTGARRPVQVARECTYPDFLKCQPLNFKGTEGVVGLTQWFEKMESVYSISNCTVACQVKFATCTLQGNALTWWNSHVKTTTPEAAHAMPWRTLKKMMTDKYCDSKQMSLDISSSCVRQFVMAILEGDLEVAFHSKTCYVRNLEGDDLLTGGRESNLYTISISDMVASSPIRTDNGTEFKNATLKAHYEKLGIMQQFSTARTPQQNGVVERRNRTLVEAARTMLIFSRLPEFLWAEAVATACFTQNWSIIHTRHNKTPYELLRGRKPNVEYFHVFGSLCYPTNDRDDLGKMKPKADIGVFIGYSETSRGFRIYNRRTKKIIESINVKFDEHIYGF
ncbi:retrovirus-related pol polyprotein from transposon TNT 1-94 [Tanacetum coccineum]